MADQNNNNQPPPNQPPPRPSRSIISLINRRQQSEQQQRQQQQRQQLFNERRRILSIRRIVRRNNVERRGPYNIKGYRRAIQLRFRQLRAVQREEIRRERRRRWRRNRNNNNIINTNNSGNNNNNNNIDSNSNSSGSGNTNQAHNNVFVTLNFNVEEEEEVEEINNIGEVNDNESNEELNGNNGAAEEVINVLEHVHISGNSNNSNEEGNNNELVKDNLRGGNNVSRREDNSDLAGLNVEESKDNEESKDMEVDNEEEEGLVRPPYNTNQTPRSRIWGMGSRSTPRDRRLAAERLAAQQNSAARGGSGDGDSSSSNSSDEEDEGGNGDGGNGEEEERDEEGGSIAASEDSLENEVGGIEDIALNGDNGEGDIGGDVGEMNPDDVAIMFQALIQGFLVRYDKFQLDLAISLSLALQKWSRAATIIQALIRGALVRSSQWPESDNVAPLPPSPDKESRFTTILDEYFPYVNIDMIKCNVECLVEFPEATLCALSYAISILDFRGKPSDMDTLIGMVKDTYGLNVTRTTFKAAVAKGVKCGLLNLLNNRYSFNGTVDKEKPVGVRCKDFCQGICFGSIKTCGAGCGRNCCDDCLVPGVWNFGSNVGSLAFACSVCDEQPPQDATPPTKKKEKKVNVLDRHKSNYISVHSRGAWIGVVMKSGKQRHTQYSGIAATATLALLMHDLASTSQVLEDDNISWGSPLYDYTPQEYKEMVETQASEMRQERSTIKNANKFFGRGDLQGNDPVVASLNLVIQQLRNTVDDPRLWRGLVNNEDSLTMDDKKTIMLPFLWHKGIVGQGYKPLYCLLSTDPLDVNASPEVMEEFLTEVLDPLLDTVKDDVKASLKVYATLDDVVVADLTSKRELLSKNKRLFDIIEMFQTTSETKTAAAIHRAFDHDLQDDESTLEIFQAEFLQLVNNVDGLDHIQLSDFPKITGSEWDNNKDKSQRVNLLARWKTSLAGFISQGGECVDPMCTRCVTDYHSNQRKGFHGSHKNSSTKTGNPSTLARATDGRFLREYMDSDKGVNTSCSRHHYKGDDNLSIPHIKRIRIIPSKASTRLDNGHTNHLTLREELRDPLRLLKHASYHIDAYLRGCTTIDNSCDYNTKRMMDYYHWSDIENGDLVLTDDFSNGSAREWNNYYESRKSRTNTTLHNIMKYNSKVCYGADKLVSHAAEQRREGGETLTEDDYVCKAADFCFRRLAPIEYGGIGGDHDNDALKNWDPNDTATRNIFDMYDELVMCPWHCDYCHAVRQSNQVWDTAYRCYFIN